jgi:hypothetical protein
MKALKITQANAAAIESALHAVNGRAITHAYTTFAEIERLAEFAERRLDTLGMKKGTRAGACVAANSAANMPNAYKYPRIVTGVALVRKSEAWFLTFTCAFSTRGDATPPTFTLTLSQDAELVANLRKNYLVAII